MTKNKKIWITGASSGIGKATAKKFADNGWLVAVQPDVKKFSKKCLCMIISIHFH